MGFSYIGLIIGFVLMFPSIIFMIKFPPINAPVDLTDAGLIFTILERIGQIGCLTILVISPANFQGLEINVWALLIALCITIYYALWIRYILNRQEHKYLFKPLYFIPVPLAVFPVLAFAFTSIWGNSLWLGIATILLAVGHITNTYHSYKQIK